MALSLLGTSVLALFLRYHLLAGKPLFMDEANGVAIAELPWSRLLHVLATREANMAAYYVFLHAWTRLADGELWLRLPSVLFSVATVPALFFLGRRLFDQRTGAMAALLLAVNAFHVESAQNARSYALLVLLCTLSTLAFLRACAASTRRGSAAYVALTTLAVYTHFFALLLVAAHAVTLAASWRRLPRPRQVATSIGAVMGLAVPILLFIFLRDTGQLDWVPALDASAAAALVRSLAGGGFAPPIRGAQAGELALVLLLTACGLAGLVAAARRRAASTPPAAFTLLLAWLLVPPAIAALVSVLVQPVFVAHYLEVCLPPFLLLAAAGLMLTIPRALAAVAVLAVSALAIWEYHAYVRSETADFRSAATYVARQAGAQDGVVLYGPNGRWSFDYYCARLPASQRCPAIAFPGLSTRFWVGGPYVWDSLPEYPSPDLLRSLHQRFARVWLLESADADAYPAVQRRIAFLLAAQYAATESRSLPGVRVVLYASPTAHAQR